MKKILSIIYFMVTFLAALCLVSCNKSEQTPDTPSDDLTGTVWSGQVTYKTPQGTYNGQNTLYFKEGSKCYNGYYEEEVSYTLSSDKKTVTMKYSTGSSTFVISGNTGKLTGSDSDGVTYQGTLTKQQVTGQ